MLAENWIGNVYGTNTGNLYLRLEGAASTLTGTLHHSDPIYGLATYAVTGSFDGRNIQLTGAPVSRAPQTQVGELTILALLQADQSMTGEWSSSIGTAGTFILHPAAGAKINKPNTERLHTIHHSFADIKLEKAAVVAIANYLQSEFNSSRVTINAGEKQQEHASFLDTFEQEEHPFEEVDTVLLRAVEPDGPNTSREVAILFSQAGNSVKVQSADRTWALGIRAKLIEKVAPFERKWSGRIRRLTNPWLASLAIALLIVFTPNLSEIQRAFVAGAALISVGLIAKAINHMLPPARILFAGQDKTAPWWERRRGLTLTLQLLFTTFFGILPFVID